MEKPAIVIKFSNSTVDKLSLILLVDCNIQLKKVPVFITTKPMSNILKIYFFSGSILITCIITPPTTINTTATHSHRKKMWRIILLSICSQAFPPKCKYKPVPAPNKSNSKHPEKKAKYCQQPKLSTLKNLGKISPTTKLLIKVVICTNRAALILDLRVDTGFITFPDQFRADNIANYMCQYKHIKNC